MKFTTEAALAAVLVDWLRDIGWEVYQEVRLHAYGCTADIVACQGPVDWVIETKRTRSLRVLEQAVAWRRRANRVSVATPRPARISTDFWDRTCALFGVGSLEVIGNPGSRYLSVIERVYAPTTRHALPTRIRDFLELEHKTHARAGSHDAAWSPFQRTAKRLVRFVRQHPGCTLKEAIEGAEHHYAHHRSARGSLRGLLTRQVPIPSLAGIESRRDGRKILLFPRQDEETRT